MRGRLVTEDAPPSVRQDMVRREAEARLGELKERVSASERAVYSSEATRDDGRDG